jgi:hypothetical protein
VIIAARERAARRQSTRMHMAQMAVPTSHLANLAMSARAPMDQNALFGSAGVTGTPGRFAGRAAGTALTFTGKVAL